MSISLKLDTENSSVPSAIGKSLEINVDLGTLHGGGGGEGWTGSQH